MIYQHGDGIKYIVPASETIASGRIRSIFARAPDIEVMRLEIEPLCQFNELPRQFQSAERRRRSESYNEHWIDERYLVDIQLADIQGTVSLLIQGSEPTEIIMEDILVTEIIYSLSPSNISRIR